jgi:hypothetical protein
MMPARNQTRVERSEDVLDKRAGYRIRANWGHAAVLEDGGHICELNLYSVPGVNPLWKPQWATIDPQRYLAGRHGRVYGPPPDGKLLAGIAGHSISFDHFGPPSEEETTAGLTTHGEAPTTIWRRLKNATSSNALCHGCTLPEARIDFRRTIALDGAQPVIYVEEWAENLSRYDRPISWNQHVTFGPPFLECGTTVFDMPATQAKVCPPGYSDRIFLQPDAEFTWPDAQTKDGGRRNLRTTPDARFGHYTAQLLDPSLEIAFISACNPRQRLLVVYAFRRADFPWVGNWEERNNRPGPPWNSKTVCRGLEFSTTPFAVPRRDTVDQGRLFGEATYRWLPARCSLTVRFVILLFRVPKDFGGVGRVSIERGRARVTEAGPPERQLAVRVGTFLKIKKHLQRPRRISGT